MDLEDKMGFLWLVPMAISGTFAWRSFVDYHKYGHNYDIFFMLFQGGLFVWSLFHFIKEFQ